ncbi:DUF4160 domain-containing protein [Nostoc linckia FACHB-104]|nr:DUF4160 domain-containing protein [Nostoc linckia FACHB-104]
MPEICRFQGLIILMFFNDHNPPHFHVWYAEKKAGITIQTFEMLEGTLPPKAYSLVVQWATLHQDELLHNWELCRTGKKPQRIEAL